MHLDELFRMHTPAFAESGSPRPEYYTKLLYLDSGLLEVIASSHPPRSYPSLPRDSLLRATTSTQPPPPRGNLLEAQPVSPRFFFRRRTISPACPSAWRFRGKHGFFGSGRFSDSPRSGMAFLSVAILGGPIFCTFDFRGGAFLVVSRKCQKRPARGSFLALWAKC
jgi:hypothetical protein